MTCLGLESRAGLRHGVFLSISGLCRVAPTKNTRQLLLHHLPVPLEMAMNFALPKWCPKEHGAPRRSMVNGLELVERSQPGEICKGGSRPRANSPRVVGDGGPLLLQMTSFPRTQTNPNQQIMKPKNHPFWALGSIFNLHSNSNLVSKHILFSRDHFL